MADDDISYCIFSAPEVSEIDFTQVLETSAESLRYSLDGTKTFVGWIGEMPSSVAALTTKGDPMPLDELLVILAGPEWTPPGPPGGGMP